VVQRWKKMQAFALASVGILGSLWLTSAWAQRALQVIGPDGQPQDITARNAAREADSLILYDPAFGPSTRTNSFGVEVIAKPLSVNRVQGQEVKTYQVSDVISVWDCQSNQLLSCGNATIPQNGVVLSAIGSKRDWLKTLKPGDLLKIEEAWFQQRQTRLDVVNPSATNNPNGSGFPGFRASNQIVMYDARYPKPTTGTNEFGFEVTVRNGIVVAQEGSDSTIPADGFVLSGHGKGRSWLIANAPLGAHVEISPENGTVLAYTDFSTYVYQFDQEWAKSPCADQAWSVTGKLDAACKAIRDQKEEAIRLNAEGKTEQAAQNIAQALESTHRRLWASYKAFPADTIRGAWHRPVEKTPAAIGETLDRLKAAGMNTVFLETFFHGYTIFPSQTYQAYGLPAQNPKFQGVDLLQAWVQQAHQRNMKVHVWFQTFYGGTNAYLPPGPILSRYPAWANVQFAALSPQKLPGTVPAVGQPAMNGVSRVYSATAKASSSPSVDSNGKPTPLVVLKTPEKPVASNLELGAYFLDPANPEVQGFLLKLVDEIVSRYDVDGFQLDYIRYPASFPSDRFSYRKTTWGYTEVARKAFKAQYGIDPADIDPKNPEFENLWKAWNAYKVTQVNQFVQKATQLVHQKKPAVKISAAVFPDADSALAVKHQDWAAWAQNGWIDFFAPMTLTSATKVVERDTRTMIGRTAGKVPVYSGIFGPFNNNAAELVLSQIDTAKQAGASGYVLFDTAHLTSRMLEALTAVQAPQQTVVPVTPTVKPVVDEAPVKPKKRRFLWWRK
jgi:uncharacterized lipoprotein YddW (UPF0748 family)